MEELVPLIPANAYRCRQQGRALLQSLLMVVHDQLSQGVPLEQVLAQVFAKQQGMVLV
jgi:hypothetical protein